ncbi:unnamed protein product [Aphanomyces euteiches]
MSKNYSPLPTDIVMTISRFLPTSTDLFSFLEALRGANHLGPLESLRQLALSKETSELWPSLEISPKDESLTPSARKALESYAMHYNLVQVHDLSCIQWLRLDRFDPNAEWHLSWKDHIDVDTWNEWTKVQITKIDITMCQEDTYMFQETFEPMLSQLIYLKAIKACFSEPLMAEMILSFAASSAELTHVELQLDHGSYLTITPTMARNVIQWFQRQSVQVLKFSAWSVQIEDAQLRDEFYNAIFSCPTLETLACTSSSMNDIDFTTLSLPMHSLQIQHCHLQSYHIDALASQLVSSGIRHLALRDVFYQSNAGTVRLFQALSVSSVEVLDISENDFTDETWRTLAPLLRRSRIKTLLLSSVEMSSEGAMCIAKTIQENDSIQVLDVSHNEIGFEGLRKIILAACDPKRPVQMHSIQCIDCGVTLTDEEQSTIQAVAATRGVEISL